MYTYLLSIRDNEEFRLVADPQISLFKSLDNISNHNGERIFKIGHRFPDIQ